MSLETASGERAEMIKPNFWPTEVFNAHHESPAHKDAITPFRFRGKTLMGVWKPPDGRPLPVGVIVVKDFDESAIKDTKVLEDKKSTLAMDPQNSASKVFESVRDSICQNREASILDVEPQQKNADRRSSAREIARGTRACKKK